MPPKRSGPGRANAKNALTHTGNIPSQQATAGISNETSAPTDSDTTGTIATIRPESVVGPSSASSRGGRGKAIIAPKPKFTGRRSQAARAELEQAAAKKKAEEAEAAAAEAKRITNDARRFGYGRGNDRGGRGGGRGGRARGGHMGDSHRQREDPVASGPFSAGQVNSEGGTRRSGWSTGGGPGAFRAGEPSTNAGGGSGRGYGGYGSGSTASIKVEDNMGDITMGGMRPVKAEDGGFISSDDEDSTTAGPRQDIDQMQVIDLTNDDDRPTRDDLPALIPVRLTRVPHKDRTVGLNVEEIDSSDDEELVSAKRKGKQKVKDFEITGASEKPNRPTAYSSSDTETELQVKQEPTGDKPQEAALITSENASMPIPSRDPPSSPDPRRKAKAKLKESLLDDSDDFIIPDKPKFQTQAEKDEWQRKYLDLKSVCDELGSLIPETATVAPQADADGDLAMAESAPTLALVSEKIKRQQADREQHVYLFQFPPVLPDLAPITVKEDPETIRVAHPTDRNKNDDASNAMDIDQQQQPRTAEEPANDPKPEEESKNPQPKLPSGSVGKLKIQKSGKATLDWGGTSLLLGMGTDTTYLQSVMIAQLPDKKPLDEEAAPSQDQEPAVGMGMGIVRAKFVLTPNWEEIIK